MPATFAHPAAILPLRRFCPRRLNFTALVIGSIAPDFGYFVAQWELATVAHTFAGSITVCVPIGVLVFSAWQPLRAPVWFLLPDPHRAALASRLSHGSGLSDRGAMTWMAIAASVLLGAWTHCVWDSLTHESGWAVRHLPLLRVVLLDAGDTTVAAYHLLQQASTILGLAVLALAYATWLRKQPPRRSTGESDTWRYSLLSAVAVISLLIALPLAAAIAAGFTGVLAMRVLVFRTAIYSIAAFVPLLAIAAIAVQVLRRR